MSMLLVLVLPKHCYMYKQKYSLKCVLQKVGLTISGESREGTCSFSIMPEKSLEAVHF